MTVEQTTGTDGQMIMMTAAEEASTVEKVDPLACSPTAPAVASGEFMISHYSVEDTLIASPVKADDGSDMDSVKSIGGIGRRVARRRRAVVDDDGSDTVMSIVSITSADEDTSRATSSSRPGQSQGVKRRREPVKVKGKADKGSNEERKGKKKGKKRKEGRKDTPEEEEGVGTHGEPKGIVDHDLEDMSSEVLGGAIQDWANTIEDIRLKSKNM